MANSAGSKVCPLVGKCKANAKCDRNFQEDNIEWNGFLLKELWINIVTYPFA
jgi:hypothetical protein